MRSFHVLGKKIIGVGSNYRCHIAEMGGSIPREPIFFLKPTSSYVLEPNPIRIPEGHEVHHERRTLSHSGGWFAYSGPRISGAWRGDTEGRREYSDGGGRVSCGRILSGLGHDGPRSAGTRPSAAPLLPSPSLFPLPP